ncbi:MAG: hypothetical protein GEV06_19700 [Luteitalea sp.]|nr:hypothetical protein [Luteitalea sp.]
MNDMHADPIRTLCAWCVANGRPQQVLVDRPLDARGLSHGICDDCRREWERPMRAAKRGKAA